MRELLNGMIRWFKSKETAAKGVPAQNEKPTAVVVLPNEFESQADMDRSKVLEWQDHWLCELAVRWGALHASLTGEVEKMVEEMSVLERFRKGFFLDKRIKPLIEKKFTSLCRELTTEIQVDLNRLNLDAALPAHVLKADDSRDPIYKRPSVRKMTGALLPTAVGVAAVPFTVSGSVVSAGGLLGLIGATTVAWPVVAGGAAIAAALGATGIINTRKLIESSQNEFKDGLKVLIWQLAVESDDGSALAQQMQRQVHAVAQGLLKRQLA